jgi:hypothetical protein
MRFLLSQNSRFNEPIPIQDIAFTDRRLVYIAPLQLPEEVLRIHGFGGPIPNKTKDHFQCVFFRHQGKRLENLRGPIKVINPERSTSSWHINQLNQSVFSHTSLPNGLAR